MPLNVGIKVFKNGKLISILVLATERKQPQDSSLQCEEVLIVTGPDRCSVYFPLSPHRQKVTGSIPTRGPLGEELTCSRCVCVSSHQVFRLPHAVVGHT